MIAGMWMADDHTDEDILELDEEMALSLDSDDAVPLVKAKTAV